MSILETLRQASNLEREDWFMVMVVSTLGPLSMMFLMEWEIFNMLIKISTMESFVKAEKREEENIFLVKELFLVASGRMTAKFKENLFYLMEIFLEEFLMETKGIVGCTFIRMETDMMVAGKMI
eukprot:GHVR01098861.1.p1 GENE.GHVR01098861.1~~GHVR01098861.1.p1  ORF type:complete len:124 (+),score=15.42 GHVR01098861.1:540-911(+)